MNKAILRFLICLLSTVLISCGGTQQGNTQASSDSGAGKEVYDRTCIACHMADGSGVQGLNPPLKNTDWVTGDKERLIGIILNGMTEPIEVDGERYTNIMNPHNFLTDQEIADVLTYIRNNFGNTASAVTAEEVAAIRAAN